jgi:hypothetical protein
MVTCKGIRNVQQSINIQSNGRFVLPITWLYVMAQNGELEVSEELMNKKSFTDEMLADLLIDFKMMSSKKFLNSSFANMVCIVNEWSVDKQWYGYTAYDPNIILRVTYNGHWNDLQPIIVEAESFGKVGRKYLDYSDINIAKINFAYANILHSFTKHVKFKGYRECQKTILLSC